MYSFSKTKFGSQNHCGINLISTDACSNKVLRTKNMYTNRESKYIPFSITRLTKDKTSINI